MTEAAGPVTRVAAYVLARDSDGRLLLCRVSEDIPERGGWTLPGGGLDFGEAPADGALRELAEETGLSGQLDGVADVVSTHVPESRPFGGRPLHSIAIVYRGQIVGGALRDEVDGSTDTCAWFSRDELPNIRLLPLAERAARLAWQG